MAQSTFPFSSPRNDREKRPVFFSLSYLFGQARIVRTIRGQMFSSPLVFQNLCQGCKFVPYTFSETKPQMVPMDLNIGFQGLALIQGQIYNPVCDYREGQMFLPANSWCLKGSDERSWGIPKILS